VTGASDVVLEVHYPNKSNSVMQQNAKKNVKRNDNNNTKSHPNTKKRAPSIATSTPQVSQLKSPNALNVKNNNTKSHPNTKKCLLSVATSTPQVSQLKSPDALNVKRQLKFQGNSVTIPYLNTKHKVSSFKSPVKMIKIQAFSSIATPPTKVSPLYSPEKTIRTRTNYGQTKTELQSEPAYNKLHAFEIDWIDENVTTSEAMKYPHFTKIKPTKKNILNLLANQFRPCDIKIAFAVLIGKLCGCTQNVFYPLPTQKMKLIKSFLELVHDENSMMVNTTNQNM
jgi:hypothetical protein